MASEKGGSSNCLDERLLEVRNGALLDGEKVVAEDMGDQGQAIVLTNSRVLIIKAGITATGELNGQKISTFPLQDITSVNVRKGPLGAVIQIVTDQAQPAAQSGPPDNVIIFTGSQRMKKCESIAAKISEAIGKPFAKMEPDIPQTVEDTPAPAEEAPVVEATATLQDAPVADTVAEAVAMVEEISVEQPVETEEKVDEPAPRRRGGREAKSLAEEMFAELYASEPEHTPPVPRKVEPVNVEEPVSAPEPAQIEYTNQYSEPEPVQAVEDTPAVVEAQAEVETPQLESEKSSNAPTADEIAAAIEGLLPDETPEPEEEKEPVEAFNPNPNLPKPGSKKKNTGNKALVLIGILVAMMLIGVAVVAPLKMTKQPKPVDIDVSVLSHNPSTIRQELNGITEFETQAKTILAQSDASISSLKSALKSGSFSAIETALRNDTSDVAWQKMQDLEAPAGLAGAKDHLISGLFLRKNMVASVSASAVSSDLVAAQNAIDRFAEAESAIQQGLKAISSMKASLEQQITQLSQKK